ncbi:hypothetical protein ACM01_26390 [Streptomyces viridochromogenes]|uniref:Secreted protein n=1 Tax=Streptomyces viridochromogenes TaxID=1938 RepID=A0A0J7Z7Y1_STRVR|nr:hypothetical protein ACM01_26390 [Streptomyces viridochromogenes]KOG18755.1 hypothetical protein ADK36_21260 [Streptomyces viridochromogenes]KOG23625.1 hypothetical protein ADK35_12115 [Streptomyces viridochromogenes]
MLKRAFAVAGLVVAGTIVPLATATPASATAAQCTGVLKSYGLYTIGPKTKIACGWFALPGKTPHPECWSGLMRLGVRQEHALKACSWA